MPFVMRAVALVALLSSAAALQLSNSTDAKVTPTEKDVERERVKLEKMSVMLGSMLKAKGFAHSKLVPALKLFEDNLQSVLNSTKSMKPEEAMSKLEAAKAGVTGLVSDMTKQKEDLMREDVEQRDSLLMGVLMTNKDKPMEKQLEILKTEDFEGLDVSKELIKTHENKTALYMQAAKYLDTHKEGSIVASFKTHAARAAATAAVLDKRVSALEKEAKEKEARHKKTMDSFAKLVKKGGKTEKMQKAIMKRQERNYKKWAASEQHNIAIMKEAATAVHNGDPKALAHARAALQQSLDNLKNKNSGMLVFLQQANTYLQTDCPFCAAQCVEKCHNDGKSYVVCMGDCKDAGTGGK